MADLGGVFNANEIEIKEGFEALPNGDYLAVITSSEMKPNSKGTGAVLVLTWQVIDGPQKGKTLREWLNLKHDNPDAVRIARENLAKICRAVGVMTPSDSSQLHDLPCVIKVICEKLDNGNMTNKIKAYKSRADQHAQTQAQPSPTQAAGRPWQL